MVPSSKGSLFLGLVGWLVGWLVGCLVAWLVGCLVGGLVQRKTGHKSQAAHAKVRGFPCVFANESGGVSR